MNYKKDFSPETWMELSYDSVEAFKNLEDAIMRYQFEMLNKGIELDFNDWLNLQMSQVNQVNKGIIGIVRSNRKHIKELFKESLDEATKIAEEKLMEVNEGKSIRISNKEAVEKSMAIVDDSMKILVANHTKATASIAAKIYANISTSDKAYAWTMEKHLEEFHKAIELSYKKELPNMTSVNYANGRNVSFKSYMEMAIRTEVNNVAVNMMEAGCTALGIVLFLASSLSDSAPDHAPYQGKCYILENWKDIVPQEHQEKYQDLIDSQNMQTLEWVKEYGTYTTTTGKVYPIKLCVRPNCRHTFTPITYEQACNVSNTINSLGLKSTGVYNKDKYIQMQKQRNLERSIRSKKLEYQNKLSEIKMSKNSKDMAALSVQAEALKKQIRDAQAKLRSHIDAYPYLDRQYQRENPMKMISSLGVKR